MRRKHLEKVSDAASTTVQLYVVPHMTSVCYVYDVYSLQLIT